MATTLNTPVSLSAPNARIENFQLTLRLRSDGSVDTQESILGLDLVFRTADGAELRRTAVTMPLQDVSAAVKTRLRALNTSLLAGLRALGVLGAGVDTDDV